MFQLEIVIYSENVTIFRSKICYKNGFFPMFYLEVVTFCKTLATF